MTNAFKPGLEWWLDSSITGYPVWAVIRVNDHGEISVLDIDGRLSFFSTLEEARTWLREEEYEPYVQLLLDKGVAGEPKILLSTPPVRGYNTDLLDWMRQQSQC